MKEFIYTVGVLLRLPFFIVGVVGYTPAVPLWFLIALLCCGCMIPCVFLKAAFKNDPSIFQNCLTKARGILTDVDNEMNAFYPYSSMYRWLIKGSLY